jgi:hypothetical protein
VNVPPTWLLWAGALAAMLIATSCNLALDFEDLQRDLPASGAGGGVGGGAGAGGGGGSGGGGSGGGSGGGGGALDQGLVFHLPFDEGRGSIVADVSGAGHDGSIVGTSSWIQGSCSAWAVELNTGDAGPNDYVQVSATPEATSAITVSAWVWLEPDQDANGGGHIISKTGAAERGWALAVTSDLEITFHISPDGVADVVAASAPVAPSEWIQVAGVFRPAESVEVWVNGVREKFLPAAATTQHDANLPARIGLRAADDCCRLRGRVDEVRFYARALTPEELQALSGGCP